MRLIHISDPHLTSLDGIPAAHFVGKRRLGHASWRFRRRHRHLRATLDALCALASSLRPDVVVVTGDLVHLGLPAEIEEAANWLRALGSPDSVFLVPGNHDVYRADSWAAVEAHWGEYLRLAPVANGEPAYWAGFPTRLGMDGVEIHGLNTGLPTPVFMATGELGRGQCERLTESLASTPAGSLNILAIHHPPAPGAVPERKALKDMQHLAPAVDMAHLVLHGHGHFNRFYRHGAVPVFATGSASKSNAPFRCFDMSRKDSGWHVEMHLHCRKPGGFAVVESRSFEFPG